MWENILITSTDGSFRATTIMGIDVYRNGNMEETMNAHSGETVGIWVDILKEKINKGMGVFKKKDEVDEPSIDELIESLNKITENAVKSKNSELNTQLMKYLVPLKSKEMELIYLDDYGDLCFDLWWEECDRFIEKKLMILKLDIVEGCRLIFKENYEHKISYEMMEICDDYLNSNVVDRIRNHIVELLEDFEN